MSADLPDGCGEPHCVLPPTGDVYCNANGTWQGYPCKHCKRPAAPASPAKEALDAMSNPRPSNDLAGGHETDFVTKEATREGETPGSRYATRDIEDLCEYYTRHLDAMTREGLHSKSDIAAELGWRDRIIEAAERRAADAEAGERTELSSVAKLLAFQPPYQARLAKRVEAIIAERDNLKERITAAESERDALRAVLRDLIEWADTMWSSRPAAARFPLTNVAIERAREALAPASETTTAEE